MSLDLGEPPTTTAIKPCGVSKAIDAHPEDADELLAAIFDPRWPARALSERLAAQQPPVAISGQQIGHHRRRACVSCEAAGRYPA